MRSSNEITAIPELLKVLDISGCLVTIDAIGCQNPIVKSIIEGNGDYIITLKKNQGNLYQDVAQLFQEAIRTQFQGFNKSEYHTNEINHGREEIRHYLMLNDINNQIDPNQKWSKLNSIGMVEYIRTVDGKTQVETRYYISSLDNNAKLLGQSVRSHWGASPTLAFRGTGFKGSLRRFSSRGTKAGANITHLSWGPVDKAAPCLSP